MKFLCVFSFFCASAFLNIAFGWGQQGHRVVGQIAQSYLTKKAATEVQKILGNESLAISTNWADFIKSDPAYKQYAQWHYVNLPAGLSKDAIINFLKTDTTVSAYTQINFLRKELRNNKLLPLQTKQEYLKFLVHIVGDIHQPLHLGRMKDRGGNSVRLVWFRDSVNLHQVWDEKLIEHQELSYTEYATMINYSTKEQRAQIQGQSLEENLFDTYRVTENIYAETKPGSVLRYEYDYKFNGILNTQLLKGGIYLAGILNSIYS